MSRECFCDANDCVDRDAAIPGPNAAEAQICVRALHFVLYRVRERFALADAHPLPSLAVRQVYTARNAAGKEGS